MSIIRQKKKNVFKITTTQKNEIYFACDSTEELKQWSSKISEINQSTLNINLIKQLTEKSIKKRSINPAQKSPNIPRQRLKNRATFGQKLELCPLCDFGVPLVVVLCCEVIEARLDQDGTGIYRRNGNKPIVDQLEEEMNKNIEIFTKDHELMKDVKNVASVLKSFFRKLPEPLFTDEHYDSFIQTTFIKDESIKLKKIRNLLVGLPQHHYSTARYLIRHLSRVAQSENTRMDSKNLATVIAPNLIRSTTGNLISDVKYLNNQCSLIDTLISRYDWFFEKSTESEPSLSQSDQTGSSDQPTDLTKLFHSALQGTSSTLNQSMEDSKKSSFFSFGKKSNSVQNSKENISENTPSSPLNRTDPLISPPSSQKVHKSRKDRLEVNSRTKKSPTHSNKSPTHSNTTPSRKKRDPSPLTGSPRTKDDEFES